LCVKLARVVSDEFGYLLTSCVTKSGSCRGEEEMREKLRREKKKKMEEVVAVMFKVVKGRRNECEKNVRRRGCI